MSVATAGLPMRETTSATSGTPVPTASSSRRACSIAPEIPRSAARVVWMTSAPSSRVGASSPPRVLRVQSASPSAPTESPSSSAGRGTARRMAWPWRPSIQRTRRGARAGMSRSRMNCADAAGMKVNVKSRVTSRASTTVMAIGRNILPSTPVGDSTGT